MKVPNRMLRIFGIAGILCTTSIFADSFEDQIIFDSNASFSGGSSSSRQTIDHYDSALSKYDNSADEDNPYLGKVLHRVFPQTGAWTPTQDYDLMIQRIQKGVELYRQQGVTSYNNGYSMFRAVTDFLGGNAMGYDGGKPAIAMFTNSKQVFLVYRVYEAKDGRSTLLCCYNSEGRVGYRGNSASRLKFFKLYGFRMQNGFKITEGSSTDRNLDIALIDPSVRTNDSVSELTQNLNTVNNTVNSLAANTNNADREWEMNPPHPDNQAVSPNQVEDEVESKSSIFSLNSILEPFMFGAKIGAGAYMLKEVFSNKDDDDDDEDDFGYGYGYGMDYGMNYGNGAIMGGGYGGYSPYGYSDPYGYGSMPGMMPGMMPPQTGYGYQVPGQYGSYPGTYPTNMGTTYPYTTAGAYPSNTYMPVDTTGGNYYTGGGYPATNTGYPGTTTGTTYNPMQQYVPYGGDSNMVPVTTTTAPMAPSSSSGTNSYGLNTVISQNGNTYLSTIGQ